MQKAYLYNAIFSVNRWMDEAVQGLERLKHSKDSRLDPAYFDEKLTLFEVHRALLNGSFCNNVEGSERRGKASFDKRHRVYAKKALDEVQVYRNVEAVEESRRLEGKAPRVRFLSSEEQQAWEQRRKNSQCQSERRGEDDHAQKA